MLARIEASELSLAGSFILGFIVGIVTALRIFGIAVGTIRKTFGPKSIDRPGADEVQESEKGNPP